MIDITTNFKEALEIMRQFIISKERQIKQSAKEIVNVSGDIVKDEVVKAIKEQGAVASGSLAESVSTSNFVTSSQLFEITVGSSSPHAKFVEEGVKAGGRMPPTSSIYNWMIDKGMEASERGAYLIARKISERGLPARRPFAKGVERARGKINRQADVILDKNLKKN